MLLNASYLLQFNIYMYASFEFLFCIFYLKCYIILVLNLRLAWVFDNKIIIIIIIKNFVI